MKKTALILAALIAGSSVRAQDATSSYSLTLDFPYVSEYVFRGISYADDAVQPSIEFATGDFYAGIWTSLPVTNGFTNEYDFYAGYGIAVSETWALDLGATYYYYPQTDSGDEQFEPFVGISGDIGGGFTSSLYVYYETEFKVFTYQGSLGYSIPLSDTMSLDLSGTLGYVDPDAGESYAYWGLGSVLTYKLNQSASAYVGLNYANNDLDWAEGDFLFVNTGVTIGF
ncbi:MAG TPA: TorF family putative porin [Candidatus Synoicihabitans sp.]|nr:TorF family putative porin [Candidatus Synoicihabitans sp.]